MVFRFQDRSEAGLLLANKLKSHEGRTDVVVLALARGGVPVGCQVAERLKARLDVFVVRKLGAPGHEEFAMGAIASGGVCFLNEETIEALRIPRAFVEEAIAREQEELVRRENIYRDNEPPVPVQGQIVLLVDDGLATGASMRAAVMAVRKLDPARIIVAVPVAAQEVCRQFRQEVDEVVCVQTPDPFFAVGEWYADFGQVSDEEVRRLLERGKLAGSVL